MQREQRYKLFIYILAASVIYTVARCSENTWQAREIENTLAIYSLLYCS